MTTNWQDRVSGGAPEKPAGDTPRPHGGVAARARARVEEYKEAIGLLQQFAAAGLHKLHSDDPTKYDELSVQDVAGFRPKYPGSSRIEIRVPGRDEAKALQNILRKSLGLSETDTNPLERKQRTTERNGKVTYIVCFDVDKFSAHQCKVALEAAIRALGHEPEGQKHYIAPNEQAEAEFRELLRKAEAGETIDPDTPAGQKPRLVIDDPDQPPTRTGGTPPRR